MNQLTLKRPVTMVLNLHISERSLASRCVRHSVRSAGSSASLLLTPSCSHRAVNHAGAAHGHLRTRCWRIEGSSRLTRRATWSWRIRDDEMGVLLYWPNIVGYVRIGLVLAAWAVYDTPALFVPLYSVYIALDGVDGWLARRLDQTSRFGAWLDVVVDNLGRGMLWSLLFEWGFLVCALEWCVFVCNHSTRGDQWKKSFSSSPPLIQAIMANGFRTPVGVWVVSGLHCLPLWLYVYRWGLLSHWLDLPLWIQAAGTLLLAVGRLLALSAEAWCIWTHIEYLTSDEMEGKNN